MSQVNSQPATTSEVQQTEVQQTEVQTLFESILSDSHALQSNYKKWSVTVKKLQKEMEKEQKKLAKKKPKRQVKQNPQKVTKSMRTFMTKNYKEDPVTGIVVVHSEAYTRQMMMKAVSAYIKEHTLQNPENKKKWKRDATLTKLFGLKKEWYTFMEINGILSRVVVKKA